MLLRKGSKVHSTEEMENMVRRSMKKMATTGGVRNGTDIARMSRADQWQMASGEREWTRFIASSNAGYLS